MEKQDFRITQIEDWIEEYHTNPDTTSLAETALAIHELYSKEMEIVRAVRAFLGQSME